MVKIGVQRICRGVIISKFSPYLTLPQPYQGLKVLVGKHKTDNKQLLDEVFVISGIIKVEVSVISRSRRLRLITLTDRRYSKK